MLLVATSPPTGRVMLVNGYDAWLETPAGRVDLTAQRYQGDVIHPSGHRQISAFTIDPWPTWTYALPDGNEVTAEILATPPEARTILRWRLARPAPGVTLHVRPLVSGRDYHALHQENAACRTATERRDGTLRWQPYPHLPAISSATNGVWTDDPQWYRRFLYLAERERGLDDTEDLLSPGVMTWALGDTPAIWMVGTARTVPSCASPAALAAEVEAITRAEGRRRAGFADWLARAADAYLVQRGVGKTIVAGYPWFTDWGRDTFIALRGLCLATGRLADARDILLEWASTVSEGMLPNRFPDGAEPPEYNAIDASLWYVVATSELLALTAAGDVLAPHDRHRLESVILAVLEGLARGTRYGIRCDSDGLLACGAAGRAVDVDGRTRRRSRDHAAGRQAGGGAGALDQRPRGRRAAVGTVAGRAAAGDRRVRAPLLERTAGRFCTTSSTWTTSPGPPTTASGRIRSSPSAACPMRSSAAHARGRWSTWSKRSC